jgi:hypothetical protein
MTARPPSRHAQADQLREQQLLCFRMALESIAAGDPGAVRIAQVALEAGGYAMTWARPAAVAIRSPYYVVPVAALSPPEGFLWQDDAQLIARALWHRGGLTGPLAVVQVALQLTSVDPIQEEVPHATPDAP